METTDVPVTVCEKAVVKKSLTLLPVVALIFFEVSGGPFGSEDAVSAGGPLVTVLAFIVLPLVFSIPEALITSELSTMFPEDAGYVAWVTSAFGEFWGFLEGTLSWCSGVADNALYPMLFLSYLEATGGFTLSTWPRFFSAAVITVVLALLNYRGLQIVGYLTVVVAIIILVPFVLFVLIGCTYADFNLYWWSEVNGSTRAVTHSLYPPSGVQWSVLLNTVFWNVNYFDSVSTLTGEIKDVNRTLPRAIGLAVILVVGTYLLPILVGTAVCVRNPATGTCQPFTSWHDGYFSNVSFVIGGRFLQYFMLFAAGISNIGLFEAEMSSDSFQLLGMAERGILPKIFAVRSSCDTPRLGILLSSLGVILLAFQSFQDIISLLNLLYIVAILLQFAAFIWLRHIHPAVPRPYKVPITRIWVLCVMLLPTVAMCVILIVTASWLNLIVLGAVILISIALFLLLKYLKKKKPEWFIFDDVQLHLSLSLSAGHASPHQDAGQEALAQCLNPPNQGQPRHPRDDLDITLSGGWSNTKRVANDVKRNDLGNWVDSDNEREDQRESRGLGPAESAHANYGAVDDAPVNPAAPMNTPKKTLA